MTYRQWLDVHSKKHKALVDALVLKNFTQEQIIEYFDFENMVKEENDFCFLYKENKKCHDIKSLNCYFCACPHFRFDDKGIQTKGQLTQYSFCSIHSKEGKQGIFGNSIHQDCSNCKVPHAKEYVKKHLSFQP
ncbi:hypothetical protein KKG72_01535 [bacterium]|nr:hypothetical protein [bacterium]MBU1993354.1 hypothetical protein [bacterium]